MGAFGGSTTESDLDENERFFAGDDKKLRGVDA